MTTVFLSRLFIYIILCPYAKRTQKHHVCDCSPSHKHPVILTFNSPNAPMYIKKMTHGVQLL